MTGCGYSSGKRAGIRLGRLDFRFLDNVYRFHLPMAVHMFVLESKLAGICNILQELVCDWCDTYHHTDSPLLNVQTKGRWVCLLVALSNSREWLGTMGARSPMLTMTFWRVVWGG